jgi:hypothetical protein
MFKPRQNPGAASLNRNLLSFVIWAGCASSTKPSTWLVTRAPNEEIFS